MGEINVPVIDKERTGNRIKMLMQNKRITVSQLQLMLGMPSGILIYKWLNGTHLPSTERLMQLAKVFNCHIEDIIVVQES